jgi:hypothetical protein
MRKFKSLINIALCFAIALSIFSIVGVAPLTQTAYAEGSDPGGLQDDSVPTDTVGIDPPGDKLSSSFDILGFIWDILL